MEKLTDKIIDIICLCRYFTSSESVEEAKADFPTLWKNRRIEIINWAKTKGLM
jgi:hypothetical protein